MSYYSHSKGINTNEWQSVIDHLESTANTVSGFAYQFRMENLHLWKV